jgi:SAM-dependent methyltransferase
VSGSAEEHYRGEAGRLYQQQKRAVPELAIPWVARLRAAKFQPRIKASDSVIEFGVGLGWNLAQLQCARRLGTDLENFLPPALITAGIEFFANSNQIATETANVVICHHVLEHVENPPAMLQEARRVLKMGGLLLVNVPYEKEGRYRRFDPAEPNHHLYSWNVQTLANLVGTQNFEMVECGLGEFGYDRFAAKLALRLHVGESGFLLIRRLVHLLRPGREVRMVGRKNEISGKA